MNSIRFHLEVYVGTSSASVKEGHGVLEKVIPGLSFLPPKGTNVSALSGLDETSLVLVTNGEVSLSNCADGIEWDITLVDKNTTERHVPELTAAEVEKLIQAGWELN